MFERAALRAGEDCAVEDLAHHLHFAFGRGESPRVLEVFAHEDNAATRAAQRFVRGGGDDVRVFHGVVQQAGSNQAGGVRHVHHKERAHLVGDVAHALIVPLAAVSGAAAYDEFRFMLQGELFHLVVIHKSRFSVKVVADGVVENAGGVDL